MKYFANFGGITSACNMKIKAIRASYTPFKSLLRRHLRVLFFYRDLSNKHYFVQSVLVPSRNKKNNLERFIFLSEREVVTLAIS